MQDNLKDKYKISSEELKRAVDQIDFGKIACDGMTLIALVDLVANGDIKGSAPKSDIIFASAEHEQFYYKCLQASSDQDCYHRALFYTLGIDGDTRRHINEIYDFHMRGIDLNSLKKGWITSGSLRVIRLAFNLFLDRVPESTHKENYAVSEIFSYGNAEYFFQAIKLRYEY